MDPLRPTYTLFIYRSADGCGRDVPVAQCRIAGIEHIDGNDIRTGDADAARHQYQHGDAAIQNDGGRHGERATERQGLLYPVVPV